jgi:hypothetical protein
MPKTVFKHTDPQGEPATLEGAESPATEPKAESNVVEERRMSFSEQRDQPIPRRLRGFYFNTGS